jgi:hypothetical protein
MSAQKPSSTSVEQLDKWEWEICGKVFDSWYVYSYYNLFENSEEARPPIGLG